MVISTLAPSVKTLKKNTVGGIKKTVSTSGLDLIKRTPQTNTVGWSGGNITSDAAGFDDLYSGVPGGINEAGGIDHFRNRADVIVDHS